MWFPPLLIGIFLAPDSPWLLVRMGRYEDAKKSLLRLTSAKADPTFDADETLDMMRYTNELEKDLTKGATYLDCFKGTNLRRTTIACMLFVSQNLAGNTFSNYSTYFFQQAGLSGEIAYDFAMGQYAINFVGTFVAWGFMAWGVGRRTLFIWGLSGLFLSLIAIGFVGLAKDKNASAMATGSLMLVWAVCFQFSIGSVAYSISSEIPTRRLQVKTVALARIAYCIAAIVANTLTPYMINPTAWNWGNYAGFFWAGTCFCVLLYHFFYLPEPSGRTFAELDVLFERRTPARKFRTTEVNIFDHALQHHVTFDKPQAVHSEQA
jgi:SP family general alpha glucoside:H+ symporter-like MFS transporter